jgi:hypothetical protein
MEDAESSAGAGTLATALGPSLADVYSRMHDAAAAELALETTKADTNRVWLVRVNSRGTRLGRR